MDRWIIRVTPQVRAWLRGIATTDFDTYAMINAVIDELAEHGPGLGRPLVDSLQGSTIHNLKELPSFGKAPVDKDPVRLRPLESRRPACRRQQGW